MRLVIFKTLCVAGSLLPIPHFVHGQYRYGGYLGLTEEEGAEGETESC